MGNTFAAAGFPDLLNSTNILIIFILLMVVFFLLGMLFGINIGAGHKETKREKSSVIPDVPKNPRQANTLAQGSREKTEGQFDYPNQRQTPSRRRHRKHNSVYTL